MTTPSKTYPVTLRGELTTPLSRWLWLVKWLLAIPHLIILGFLAIASFVCWVIAFFAILFTGKYPKGLFDFNVGVMRWSWRVGFYCYQAMGTDKYPPFSLDPDPNYPADLDVQYPEKLSNGMVLVKWLLAVPALDYRRYLQQRARRVNIFTRNCQRYHPAFYRKIPRGTIQNHYRHEPLDIPRHSLCDDEG